MTIPSASSCFQKDVRRNFFLLQTVSCQMLDFYLKRFGHYIYSKDLGEMVGKVYFFVTFCFCLSHTQIFQKCFWKENSIGLSPARKAKVYENNK